MKKRAVWIFDYNYRVPALLSVSSFLACFDMDITILYCGGKAEKETAKVFEQLSPKLNFESYVPKIEIPQGPHKATIINRLARMETLSNAGEELLFLIDADIFFKESAKELIKDLNLDTIEHQPTIFGCIDEYVSAQNHLYFRVQDENQRDIKLSTMQRADIYREVFGTDWNRAQGSIIFNNGLLVAHNCQRLAEKWKAYYLKGLNNSMVNPADDQLPLAVAMQTEDCKLKILNNKYNSLGNINGGFAAFHAFSGIWEMQLLAVLKDGWITSDVAKILYKHTSALPLEWITLFIEKTGVYQPFCYQGIPGDFGFKHLYEDILSGLETGHCIEVGTYHGKSACFMAELIKYSGKAIQFDTIDDFEKQESNYRAIVKTLEQYNLLKYVEVVPLSSAKAVRNYNDHSLDFVFLNGFPDYETLQGDLELWYPKLKPGGILAGYDYGSQDGLRFGYQCASFRFCKANGLSLRIDFDIFIIQVPDPYIQKSPGYEHALSLETNSVKLQKWAYE